MQEDGIDDGALAFADAFRRMVDEVTRHPRFSSTVRTPLGEVVAAHLGADPGEVPLLVEPIAPHRYVDADLALEALSEASGERVVGVTGGDQRHHHAFPELLAQQFVAFAPGPVDYLSADVSPTSTRRVVSFGVRLLRHEGRPVAVLQRAAEPRYGRERALLEVLAADVADAEAVVEEVRRRMLAHSVLRGQVLTIGAGAEFGHGAGVLTFVERPEVAADALVIDPETLEGIVRHVVGVRRHRDALLAAGRHLKRGLLLYGPPGTGKTLTVRRLLSLTPDTTAVVLTGPSIRFIDLAVEVARAMQPSIVVLEDVDLVAQDRSFTNGSPLLFAILDALDGLGGDADVAFVLTTNRVEVLERALADRPGRIDHAAEIPLPDAEARRALFRLYADGLGLGDAALDAAADRAEGTTGSFARELMRRAVLLAASDSREVGDDDLAAALDDLLSTRSALTARLLVGGGVADDQGAHDGGHVATMAWQAYPGS